MGLDITAYRQIKKLDCEVKDGEPIGPNCQPLDWKEYAHLYSYPPWMDRADGIEDGYYSFAEAMKFRAGSYSGYNNWRNDLARLAGWKDDEEAWKATEGPFWELINFADNEGVIG